MEGRKVIEPQRSRRPRREEDRVCQNDGQRPVETNYRFSGNPAHQTTSNPNETQSRFTADLSLWSP